MSDSPHPQLKRELGVWHASALGLGSIVGTGVFVSIGIAAGVAGPAVVLGLVLASSVALCNGLSSAQLAASHPVSGGTYEYGYRYLSPLLGFIAGWLFLFAKSASAATAALGFAGYLLNAFEIQGSPLHIPIAFGVVLAVTVLVLVGIRRSAQVNVGIVSLTIFALLVFVVGGFRTAVAEAATNLTPFFAPEEGETALTAVLHASALMFVAYTGYGRIATLGEEVRDPKKTIPRAVILTLLIALLLYVSVAFVGVGSVGSAALADVTGDKAAPLEVAARSFSPHVAKIISIGAVTAMLGVLLNLILGLSRVLLAMGRRGDMPGAAARLSVDGTTPYVSVVVIGMLISVLVLTGDVRTTWSFSAFTVLIYYAITNLAAIKMPSEVRMYPIWIPVTGLIACLGLAFWVDRRILFFGLALIAAGIVWHLVALRIRR